MKRSFLLAYLFLDINLGQAFPYHEVLAHCSLAKDLRDIFNDVSEYGVVHVFLNDCIEVGFCVEPRALLHSGLTPKSR